ncbi:phosphomannomutase/phosphoglucomutase [Demetria terragena]|uniref:phosphomannomutase/phosphoglucomutase n=1 Tax=Demetria terragena TaxID=63959 RepID=UPI0003643755|nr:phosphomannomutase/phosphoglucomutase [Demetria terragena]
MSDQPRLDDFVKAYDVRGLVPAQLNPEVARALGTAYARVVVRAEGGSGLVVGHDMRESSPSLSYAFAEGAAAEGVDVTLIGLCSTDGLYYASGALDLAGAMFTASHNPARYNGIKLCRPGARPVSMDSGLAQVRDLAQSLLDQGGADSIHAPGNLTQRDVLGDYAAFLRGLVDLSATRPVAVVVDAGNGMAGHTAPAVFDPLPLQVSPLYFELDGTFPNHEANPLEPENLRDLQAAVRERGADLGLAFDGDADRCFVVDERGEPVSPSAITALIATREIARARAAGERDVAVVHSLISSLAVPEIIAERGGRPVRTRVGHSYIKAEMASADAVFGGEHSAHYYFRDFWFADSGMLAALHVLAALGESGGTLSELMAGYERYVASGEINSTVADVPAAVDRVRAWARSQGELVVDELDGLTLTHPTTPTWWLNLRSSNTEPLLRLNVEADNAETLAQVRDAALGAVRAS